MTTRTLPATMPDLSREYVRFSWTAKGIDAAQLTTLPVFAAFLSDRDAEPVDEDWKTAEWDPDTTRPTVRCLVGPGSPVGPLTDGKWYVWGRVDGAVERPIRKSGLLTIT